MRVFLACLAIAVVSPILAQTPQKSSADSNIQTVSVTSKGQDVRDVLADVFGQAKKSFVIQPNIHFVLFLSLNDMEFEEALSLICKTATLKYELQNGIYFVSRDKAAASSVPAADPDKSPEAGKLSPKVLAKRVTLNVKRTELKTVFQDLSTQSGIAIEVDPKVPDYRADVVLRAVSLKYALQNICRAAGLTYKFSDHQSLQIVPREIQEQPVVRLDP